MNSGQVMEYASGNDMAVIAINQIGYDMMGYYPITPSTQIAEGLDMLSAAGKSDIEMIPAEGEHSAAGICYGASVAGGRVINATSANGLMYALEQLPVQSGTRYPMVMNVVCRTVSGPLSIKGDHSDIAYMLNAGWIILFACTAQQVYDFNIIALKLAEEVSLPVAVAYDGFFTSHQKVRCYRFEEAAQVKEFIGDKQEKYPLFDFNRPVTVGAYMNEQDIIDNRYQLHLAMETAKEKTDKIFGAYAVMSGRRYAKCDSYMSGDAEVILVVLGSAYNTAKAAVNELREEGIKAGAVTINVLRPFPEKELAELLGKAALVVVADRQDSYGAGGGNLSLEVRAALQKNRYTGDVKNIIYGLGGMDFYVEDAKKLILSAIRKKFDKLPYYIGVNESVSEQKYSNKNVKGNNCQYYYNAPDTDDVRIGATTVCREDDGKITVKGVNINAACQMPKRLTPGHGACPGCGIPVNINLLLKGIEAPVVMLVQTGCGMIVTMPYPKTSFKLPAVHNLFQNGAATLSGIAEMCYRYQRKNKMPHRDIVFVMISGDGGMDIGMGSALATAIRGHRMIIFEYDNGGYMNTGYQLSYSTPKGAKSATSHVGDVQYGKKFFHKDMTQIMAATGIPYVATVAESNPTDFMKKAAKAAAYTINTGCVYIKALSACPLNWNDNPATERRVIQAAVDSCYFPLYEVEKGITTLNYDPVKAGKKIPVTDWLGMMGRTKHLTGDKYKVIAESIQAETDRRYMILKEKAANPYL